MPICSTDAAITGRKKYVYLHCITNHNGLGCSSHLISESKLAEVVLTALQGKIQQISGLEQRLDEINEIPKNQRRLKSVEEHMKMLEQEEQKYQSLRRQLYEDMSNGIVSKDEYKEFSRSFNEKVENIRKAKTEMNRQLDSLNNLDVEHLPWIEDFKSYQNLTSLNRRVLVELVESITVYDKEHIHIQYRFDQEIRNVLEYCNSVPTTETEGSIHRNWSGISVDSIHSLCLRAYLPEEVAKLNDIAEMRAGTKLEKPLRSEYLTISGTCFINQSSPVITISKNGIRFSKACHTRLDDCEHVELLYHPILQVVILRKSNRDASTAIHWENKDKICSSFSSRAFSGVIFEAMNWKWSCRYQCRGICRGEENAKFLFFELDESRILIRKNQYEQIEDCSMNLKCRLYRSKWIQSIAASDVMESGQVVENPMIGAIPSRNEVQRELDDLLMSM